MIVFFQRERGSKNRLTTCIDLKIAPSNDVSLNNDKSGCSCRAPIIDRVADQGFSSEEFVLAAAEAAISS